jgi:hypothetical protein
MVRIDMLHLVRRTGAALVVGVAALLASGSAGWAEDAPSGQPSADQMTVVVGPDATSSGYACLDQENGYAAPGVCQLVVVKAETVCRGNVPWLDYVLDAQGTPNKTASLVWGNENGKHYTMSDLPLSGSVMWPGTVVDAQGEAIDWPGWTLDPDGVTWHQGDEWSWLRPDVPITFHVNPSATLTAYYPEATAPCAGPPTTVVSADDGDDAGTTVTTAVLSSTGSNSTPVLLTAAGLLLAGSLVLGVRAALRRRAAAH